MYSSITDQAVAERLRACGPWVKAMLRRMLPMAAVESLPTGRRFVVIDASSIQAPGTKGTDHRLHIALDLLSLQCIEVLVAMSTPAKRSSISPWLQGMWAWPTAAMPSAKA